MKKFTDFLSESASAASYTFGDAHAKLSGRIHGVIDRHGNHCWVGSDRHAKVRATEGKNDTRIHTVASACAHSALPNAKPSDFKVYADKDGKEYKDEHGYTQIVHQGSGELFSIKHEERKNLV